MQEEDAKTITRQLLDALAYMHFNNVTHRDLKLEVGLWCKLDPGLKAPTGFKV